ncbi:MAG: hypothetical protein WBA31_07015 [Candidatus Dormiibacterota bacterium]
MAHGFYLTIRLPPFRDVTADGPQIWSLPMPVGDVELVVDHASPARGSEITLRGTDFASSEEAQTAGRCLQDWVRLSSALDRTGVDVGKDVPQSRITEAGRAALGVPTDVVIVPDVHGLVDYEYPVEGKGVRFAMRAQPTVSRPAEALHESLVRVASVGVLTQRQALVCDLVNLVEHERSDRARLFALVTAMEVLADRSKRTGPALSLVEGFAKDVRRARKASTSDLGKGDLGSLLSGLSELRFNSISASIQEVARAAQPQEPEAAAELARASYNCRSDLIHDGQSDSDVNDLADKARPLVLDMLRISISNDPPT